MNILYFFGFSFNKNSFNNINNGIILQPYNDNSKEPNIITFKRKKTSNKGYILNAKKDITDNNKIFMTMKSSNNIIDFRYFISNIFKKKKQEFLVQKYLNHYKIITEDKKCVAFDSQENNFFKSECNNANRNVLFKERVPKYDISMQKTANKDFENESKDKFSSFNSYEVNLKKRNAKFGYNSFNQRKKETYEKFKNDFYVKISHFPFFAVFR